MKKAALYLSLLLICVSTYAGRGSFSIGAGQECDSPLKRSMGISDFPHQDTLPYTEDSAGDSVASASPGHPTLVRRNAVGLEDVLRSRAEAADRNHVGRTESQIGHEVSS